jgi:acyl-ACP thioesterase
VTAIEAEFPPPPDIGRTYQGTAKVRLGDTGRDGRLRLDALARFLQDVANDDSSDAGMPREHAWLVRRTAVDVAEPIRLGEQLTLTTYCSGTGGRWAERRTSVRGRMGGHVEAVAVWVCTDPRTGRAVALPYQFGGIYGQAAGSRKVSARLTIGEPPRGVDERRWAVRATDIDVLGHMNNAAYWAAVEDEVVRRDIVAGRAVLEYRNSIELDDDVRLLSTEGEAGAVTIWLVTGAGIAAAARVTPNLRQ